ncbi:hypothetical protein KM895_15225, partial [Bacillus pumilus]|nr:hypothetical protein [Bacillus pumilus]
RFSITLKRRQSAKIKIILALCQQSEKPLLRALIRNLHIDKIKQCQQGSCDEKAFKHTHSSQILVACTVIVNVLL